MCCLKVDENLYLCTFDYNVVIPKEYEVETVYSIVFSTASFEPEDRKYSIVSSSIVCTSRDKEYIEDRMQYYIKYIPQPIGRYRKISDNWVCWHTEDFAHNQVIHSYNICTSYIVNKVNNEKDEPEISQEVKAIIERSRLYDQSDYITIYEEVIPKRKTSLFHIISNYDNTEIGLIKWYGAWRKFTVLFKSNTLWDTTCIKDLIEYLTIITDEYKQKKGKN